MARQAQKTVGDVLADLWRKACEFDGIDPTSKFVVFSEENKFARFHSAYLTEARRQQAEWEAGGYVGMTIKNGKARGKFACRMG